MFNESDFYHGLNGYDPTERASKVLQYERHPPLFNSSVYGPVSLFTNEEDIRQRHDFPLTPVNGDVRLFKHGSSTVVGEYVCTSQFVLWYDHEEKKVTLFMVVMDTASNPKELMCKAFCVPLLHSHCGLGPTDVNTLMCFPTFLSTSNRFPMNPATIRDVQAFQHNIWQLWYNNDIDYVAAHNIWTVPPGNRIGSVILDIDGKIAIVPFLHDKFASLYTIRNVIVALDVDVDDVLLLGLVSLMGDEYGVLRRVEIKATCKFFTMNAPQLAWGKLKNERCTSKHITHMKKLCDQLKHAYVACRHLRLIRKYVLTSDNMPDIYVLCAIRIHCRCVQNYGKQNESRDRW